MCRRLLSNRDKGGVSTNFQCWGNRKQKNDQIETSKLRCHVRRNHLSKHAAACETLAAAIIIQFCEGATMVYLQFDGSKMEDGRKGWGEIST